MKTSSGTKRTVIERNPDWQEEFFHLMRIPSVSAEPRHAPDVMRVADWSAAFIRDNGGTASILSEGHAPIVVGDFDADTCPRDEAKTVLLYAHMDVQPPGDPELWTQADPFEPEIRDGVVYGRGSADDKSNLYIILRSLAELKKDGRLPVNVRTVFDGDEEFEGHAVVEFVEGDLTHIDVGVVLDGLMLGVGVPMFTVGARGLIQYRLRVRTGTQDLHSGLFGGVGLNAIHALQQILGVLISEPDELREGAVELSDSQLSTWDDIAQGSEQLRSAGGRPVSEEAIANYHRQTFARPSLSVNGITGGEVVLSKTIIPVEAAANVSIRLAPGQSPERINAIMQQLVESAAPQGCEVSLVVEAAESGSMTDPDNPYIRAAMDPFERVFGGRPVLLPMGASVPILSALANRGIPAVQSGFALPDANFHAPDERFVLEHLWLGLEAVTDMLLAYGDL